MNILIAPDSFKGTLSSQKIIDIIAQQAGKYFPACTITGVPIADGGEGTVQAVLSTCPGLLRTVEVTGPLFEPVKASYAILPPQMWKNSSPAGPDNSKNVCPSNNDKLLSVPLSDCFLEALPQKKNAQCAGSQLSASDSCRNQDGPTAVIEMAAASGITLIPAAIGNALHTTSYGTGQLIADAISQGCRKIVLALGGSATNDGGCGAMSALGFRFLDNSGQEITPTGENLIHIRHIETAGILPALKEISMTVMCDVKNPFCGQNGATYTYGPQKGASAEHLSLLEKGMKNFAEIIRQELGKDIANIPGAGAAGGMGGALSAFLNGRLASGILTMLELVQFQKLASQADLIITGEGLADEQSAQGKVLWGIGQYAKAAGIPAVAIVGGVNSEAKALYEYGITAFVPALNYAMPLEEVLSHAEELLSDAAERTFRILKAGLRLQ